MSMAIENEIDILINKILVNNNTFINGKKVNPKTQKEVIQILKFSKNAILGLQYQSDNE